MVGLAEQEGAVCLTVPLDTVRTQTSPLHSGAPPLGSPTVSLGNLTALCVVQNDVKLNTQLAEPQVR